MKNAKIISIEVRNARAGLMHATSPQMRELFVSGETIDEILASVPAVIEAIYEAHGEQVSVVAADDSGIGIPMPWVILPKLASDVAQLSQ